ncbi:MAG: 50S ribosomal protein L21 [Burkholderiales bacterium]
MYAVIKTGGKQYRVSAGDKLRIEQIAAQAGSTVIFDQILLVGDGDAVSLGTPMLATAKVNATILGHGRGDKIRVFKMKRRKNYRRTLGHRQNYTEIRVDAISA